MQKLFALAVAFYAFLAGTAGSSNADAPQTKLSVVITNCGGEPLAVQDIRALLQDFGTKHLSRLGPPDSAKILSGDTLEASWFVPPGIYSLGVGGKTCFGFADVAVTNEGPTIPILLDRRIPLRSDHVVIWGGHPPGIYKAKMACEDGRSWTSRLCMTSKVMLEIPWGFTMASKTISIPRQQFSAVKSDFVPSDFHHIVDGSAF